MSSNIIYKQLNSKWASLPYPTRNSSFGGNGCGCCACTHVALEQPWKADYTPNTLRPWMIKQGFAISGQGTTWSGINETLKHLGHKSVVWIGRNDPMSKAWAELNKGDRIGVMLVDNSKTPDGTYWTASGHYVMFYKYAVENGKHYFWIKDSGGRNHDGKFCYEKSLKGAIPQMWIVERISVSATKYRPKKPYGGRMPSGLIKKGSKGLRVKRLQIFLNWCIGTKLKVDGDAGENTIKALCVWQKTYGLDVDGDFGAISLKKANAIVAKYAPKPAPTKQDKMLAWAKKIADEKYHYVKWKEGVAKTHTCPICNGRKYDDYYGWNCIGFAWASWHHGAGLPSRCSCSVFTDYHYNQLLKLGYTDASKLARQRIGLDDVYLMRSYTSLSFSQLKAGDIIAYFNGNGYIHTALYIGNGQIADCTSSRADGIKYGVSSYSNYKIKLAFRYTGK